jgi:hypothetical protein
MLVTFCVLSVLTLLEAYPVRNKTREMSILMYRNDYSGNDNLFYDCYKRDPVYRDWNRFTNKNKTMRVVNYEYMG